VLEAPADSALVAALMLGLFGNVHCLGMCGGIVGALSGRTLVPEAAPLEGWRANPFLETLLYNLGRISSYAVAGAVAGAAGVAVTGWLGAPGVLTLRGLFGLLMLAAGLSLLGWGRAMRVLERLAQPVWRQVSRGIGTLRPVDRPWKALAIGAAWGWLPCGLVYAALAGAIASGSALDGALFMTCFGVGTLPLLLAAGVIAGGMGRWLARAPVRTVAGVAIAVFGVWTLSGAVMGFRHWEHAAGHATPVGSQEGEHSAHRH